jgi:serine/threonine protein kinase
MAIKEGDKIRLTNGDSITILKKLGAGGQGIVYRVEYPGQGEFALKWYKPAYLSGLDEKHSNGRKDFKENIRKNIDKGSPSEKFLWPVALTDDTDGSFGYIMNLRPKEYDDFTDIYNTKNSEGKPVKFKSFRASVESAIGIVNAFRALHRKGYFYLDLNDGNFFINTDNGDVLVCDNDNVTASPRYSIGKPGYIAPELITGKEKESSELTDNHSLGVVLFRLFMRHDPMMGKKYCESVVLTAKKERELYGENPIFIFDPKDDSNRPVLNIHSNPIKLWPLYPEYLHQAFIQTFSEGMKDPNKRLPDKAWLKTLFKLRDDILICPCGTGQDVLWSDKTKPIICQKCKMNAGIPCFIEINGFYINLYPGNKIYSTHINEDYSKQEIYAQIIQNKQDPNKWGLENKSDDLWIVKRPDGQTMTKGKDTVISIIPDTEIELPGGKKLVIKNK